MFIQTSYSRRLDGNRSTFALLKGAIAGNTMWKCAGFNLHLWNSAICTSYPTTVYRLYDRNLGTNVISELWLSFAYWGWEGGCEHNLLASSSLVEQWFPPGISLMLAEVYVCVLVFFVFLLLLWKLEVALYFHPTQIGKVPLMWKMLL